MDLFHTTVQFVIINFICCQRMVNGAGNNGFLGTGLSLGADIGIVVGAAVGLILIVSLVSYLIYFFSCRKKSKKKKNKNKGRVYSERKDVNESPQPSDMSQPYDTTAWPSSNNVPQMFGKLPDTPNDQEIPPSRLPATMPTQAQLQQELLPTIPPPPPEPLASQPYYGALESSLEPYLAQAALATEIAQKGQNLKHSKKKKEKDVEEKVEKAMSVYDGLPPIIPSNPYSASGDGLVPETTAPKPVYQAQYSMNIDSMQAEGNRHLITAEPRAADGFPLGYQSFLPHLAISTIPSTTSQHSEPALVNPIHMPPAYPMSRRSNELKTETHLRSDKQLTRISAYDYMLH